MKIKVAIAHFPPLIFTDGKTYKGFEIDLWEAIATNIGIDFEYEEHHFNEIIPLLEKRTVDIGLAGITINERREKVIDFSHATLDSGILISVNANRNKIQFFKSIKRFIIEGHLMLTSAILFMLAYTFLAGNGIWLIERNAHTFSTDYMPGILEALWFTVVSITTTGYGDYVPHTWVGKLVVSGVIIGGGVMMSIIVAHIAAFLTTKRIKGEINSSRDLVNKRVATVAGSTSEDVLERIGAKIVPVLQIGDAYTKLKNDEIDAVVFDAPAVLYFEKHDMNNRIEIVGEVFEKQHYGIALQQPDALEEKINRAILLLQESGQYDLMYRKWFGENQMMKI